MVLYGIRTQLYKQAFNIPENNVFRRRVAWFIVKKERGRDTKNGG